MREIEFESWDSLYKIMRDHTDPQTIQAVVFSNDYGGRVKIRQYTGMKDRNGEKIYEGDIVQLVYDAQQPPVGPGIIEFGDFCIGVDDWGVKHQTPCFAISWPEESDKTEASGFGGRKNIEVIGNIYENPELLKGEGEK